MPAVNPLLAIVAPVSPSAKATRPGFALLDLPGARAPENTGVRAEVNKADVENEPVAKPFARELEKGLEQQLDQRESRRSAREKSAHTADADRKEDAAARMEAGKTLPQDGRLLPLLESDNSPTTLALVDLSPVLDTKVPLDVADDFGLFALPSELDPIASAKVEGSETDPVSFAALMPAIEPPPAVETSSPISISALPASTIDPESPGPRPQLTISQNAVPENVNRLPAPEIPVSFQLKPTPITITPTSVRDVPLRPQVATQTIDAATLEQDSLGLPVIGTVSNVETEALTQVAAETAPTAATAATAGVAVASTSENIQVVEVATPAVSRDSQHDNPFAALPTETHHEGRNLAQRPVLQNGFDTGQAQTAANAMALASGSDFSNLLDLTPGQGDLAERVRAWRSVSGIESAVAPSIFSRSETAGPSLFAQSSGQLQQFADSLRMALNLAEAPSLIPGAERNTSSSAATPAAAPGALSGAAAAAPSDAGSAWRADNLQLPALNGGARPAAGTLQFLQTMQPSNFGAPLGETFGQNAWAESVTQRVALMTGLKLSSARIELDPPELGAMTVKVSVSGDQASVSFASPHAIVRDALEQTFPRLQEMLGQQGLQLADAQVSDQSAERRQSGDAASGNRSAAEGNGDEGSESIAVQNVKVATSLIDYYA